MGTYYGISLDVTLDRAAVAALRTCQTWYHLIPGPDDELPSLHQGPGGTRLTAHAAAVRNLGRCLVQDLTMCALVGSVTGEATVTLVDGDNHVLAARFGPGPVAIGVSECLAATSIPLAGARPQVVDVALELGNYHLVSLITDGTDAGDMVPTVYYPEDCGCGGWDDRHDIPICLRAVPSRMPAHREPPDTDPLMDAWVDALTDPGPVPDPPAWSFEPLTRALLVRRHEHGLEPVGARTLASALAATPRSREVLELIASHPALTDDLAATVAGGGVDGVLAANRSLSDGFVRTLPAPAVAAGAPWRLADDDVARRVVDQMAPGSPLTAGELADLLGVIETSPRR